MRELEERVVLLEFKLKDTETRLKRRITEVRKKPPDSMSKKKETLPKPKNASKTIHAQEVKPDPKPVPAKAAQVKTKNSVEKKQKSTKKPNPTWNVAEHYRRALIHYKSGAYELAKKPLQVIVKHFNSHELLPNAWYWLAEIEYDLSNYNQAILYFQKALNFPKSAKAPDALLKLGKARERLGQWEEAAEEYQRVIDRYPHSKAAVIARRWL